MNKNNPEFAGKRIESNPNQIFYKQPIKFSSGEIIRVGWTTEIRKNKKMLYVYDLIDDIGTINECRTGVVLKYNNYIKEAYKLLLGDKKFKDCIKFKM